MKIDEKLITDNFSTGRKSKFPVDTVVIHISEGSLASARSWFNQPASDVSSHYIVGRQGEIEQYVKEEDTAWHAGRVDHPTAAMVLARMGSNVNGYTIGIEHEGSGKEDLTDAQRTASAELLRDINQRRPLVVLDRQHVIGHHEVYSLKLCPRAISISKLLAEAKAETRQASPPRLVWSDFIGDWLVVTKYVSDSEWYFQPLKNVGMGSRATARLSAMPLNPTNP